MSVVAKTRLRTNADPFGGGFLSQPSTAVESHHANRLLLGTARSTAVVEIS